VAGGEGCKDGSLVRGGLGSIATKVQGSKVLKGKTKTALFFYFAPGRDNRIFLFRDPPSTT
jgi:hypothetical protein